ncbi:MAG: DEAD/DEAH box helicase [Xanthomonadaceae bacterium]|nr:DEAD/DEAH box helicase [Xanthomonadaceae bacterium]
MKFTDYDLLPTLQTVLEEKNLKHPTEIQHKMIPALLEERSIVGVAETGSGKTLSYALPILHMLKSLENRGLKVSVDGQPRALIVVPTRELGEQVSKVFKYFTHTTRLRVRTVLGGSTLEIAKRNVQGAFEILVATPGRFVKLMERDLITLVDVRTLVFDEADQMLDAGFLPDANKIVEACPQVLQKVLLSATISPAVQKLINELFADVEIIKTKNSGQLVPSLDTENCIIKDGKRYRYLEKYLGDKITGGTIIFTNTREQCDKLVSELKEQGHSCAIYRGEMDKVERRSNLKLFRDGKINLLISTDLASRGLDVEHVGRVINYHLPREIENYIHRVGRTARAGRKGLVINFVTERDQALVDQLAKMKRK